VTSAGLATSDAKQGKSKPRLAQAPQRTRAFSISDGTNRYIPCKSPAPRGVPKISLSTILASVDWKLLDPHHHHRYSQLSLALSLSLSLYIYIYIYIYLYIQYIYRYFSDPSSHAPRRNNTHTTPSARTRRRSLA
jgi:hypothetical protein